ncbi:MAG: hypothetical protein GEU88_03285 [Solirubrobacterales bacterium]|nr:hypothetical protein [Solirubrobacterales bacterium]
MPEVLIWSVLSEDFDQGSMHSNGQSSRLVAPRDGLYAVDAQVEWRRDDTLDGAVVTLDRNQNRTCEGAARDGTQPARDTVTGSTPNENLTNDINTLVALEAGDYLELCAVQHSGEQQLVESFGFTWVTMRFVGRLSG